MPILMSLKAFWSQSGFIHRFSLWVLVASLLLAALLSLAGRILIDNVQHFRSDIEKELADYGIQGANLENLQGSWRGFHPSLKVREASLSIPGRTQALTISELELSVKLIPSLFTGDLKLHALHSQIEKLILVRNQQGNWSLNEIPLKPAEGSSRGMAFEGFFNRLPDYVSMNIGLLQVRDQLHDRDYLIQNSLLQSSRDNKGLALQFTSRLPATLGQDVTVMFSARGNDQTLYVQAGNLNIKQLLGLSPLPTADLHSARLSLQSWAELENYRMKRVVNQGRLSDLAWERNPTVSAAISADIQQQASLDEDAWQVHSRIFNLRRGQQRFLDLNLQLAWNPAQQKTSIWLPSLDVAEIRQLLVDMQPDHPWHQLVNNIQPQVDLYNVIAEIDHQQPLQSMLSLEFAQLKSLPYEHLPGTAGLNGRVLLQQGRGQLDLDAESAALNFARVFRDPLEFASLEATVLVNKSAQGFVVEAPSFALANPDIQLQGRMAMELAPGERPFMHIRASYEDGNAAATSRYLPVSIMPEGTVTWLDSSIRGGEITRGDLLFHGRAQKMSTMQRERSGIFHALFDVRESDVKFLPDWPAVTRGSGRASFSNTAMNLDFSELRFADSTIDQASVRIPDMTRARLIIDSKTESASADLLSTLSQLPILDAFDLVQQEHTAASGKVRSELHIEVPISKKFKIRKPVVKAQADLVDVGITIPDWVVDIAQTNGSLQLDNDQLTADQLQTRYFGDEAVLSVSTDAKRQRTRFQLDGVFSSAELIRNLPDYLHQPVSGKSPWQLEVSVANATDSAGEFVEILGKSDLEGSALAFPRPFNKAAEVANPFTFVGQLDRQQNLSFMADMKNRYQAQGLASVAGGDDTPLKALEIEFTRTTRPWPLKTPGKKGIHLTGYVRTVDTMAWADYLDSVMGEENVDAEEGLKLLESVDLEMGLLIIAGQHANKVRLQMNKGDNQLEGFIQSSMMQGNISLPYKMGPETPLQADLDYLILAESKGEDEFSNDIDDMPNLLVTSKVFQIQDLIFNELVLRTRCEDNRFTISQLDFLRDDIKLKSSGQWSHDPRNNEHVSVVNLTINGKKFGQTVKNLGLGETISDGKVDFEGQIGWEGEIYDVNWPSLRGELQFSLKDGVLRNVEPGAGRFVGLLSLNALPKRLALDFGDVVREGTEFKRIKGKFIIDGEQMTTNNAVMDSVSAKVKIRGSTNLREKTYDQSMFIIPKVGDTLPLIGTLAAGTTVGWGLLLLQKVFKKPIEKSVEIEYKVSGSWDEPKLTLLTKPEPDESDPIDN